MADPKRRKDLKIVGLEQKAQPQALPSRALPAVSFDAWWLLAQGRHGLSADLKDAVKNHMRAKGFLQAGRFDDGLKDFGVSGT